MTQYKVYQPIDGSINHNLMLNCYEYKFICSYTMDDSAIIGRGSMLDKVFKLSQNDLNPDYRKNASRSMSVGDVILNSTTGKYYFVTGRGFTETTSDVLSYKVSSWEQKKTDALKTFISQYPTVGSGDIQAFVLGMQAMDKIWNEKLGLINKATVDPLMKQEPLRFESEYVCEDCGNIVTVFNLHGITHTNGCCCHRERVC